MRGRARGSPISAPAPAGRASRSPPRCPTRTWRWSRARSGTAATSSARSRSPGWRTSTVVHARAEEWPDGLGAHDLVTARALAALPVILEYAAPLLAEGGHVVAWKGAVSPEEEAAGAAAAAILGLEPVAGASPSRRSRARATTRCTCSARSRPRRRASRAAPEWPRSARSEHKGSDPCMFSARRARETCRSDRAAASVEVRHGHHLRDRQPEGRGRQDDHRGQRGRVHRRGRLRDAPGRRRPAGQRHRRARRRRASDGPGVYEVLGGRGRRARRRAADRRSSASRSSSRRRTSRARRWSCRALPGSETRLRDALAPLRDDYAFILLDCPPSLGPLTVNALVAAERVIVPVQTEYFALEGLAGLLDTLVADPARAQPAPDRRRACC